MAKPNWKAITQYKCGCQILEIRLPDKLHYTMQWCPKHDAAEAIYEALRGILLSIPAQSPRQVELYEVANKVLAKAEGKITGNVLYEGRMATEIGLKVYPIVKDIINEPKEDKPKKEGK